MRKSMWCYFLLAFALVIGGIQSLGWWARPASAQAPVTHAPSVAPVQHCQPIHWRDMVMQR